MNGVNVLLTSFWHAKKYDTDQRYNVARIKPDWCKYFDLPFLAPINPNGKKILLGDNYFSELRNAYIYRWSVIKAWLDCLKNNEFIILCCWCPHNKLSKQQLATNKTFDCHTLLIGSMIRIHRPDLIIALDDDRDQYGNVDWKRWYYETELVKVISGGQTGADQGGLQAAKAVGLKTGGWMPKGYVTQTGNRPDFADLYGIKEHTSSKYPPRTFANVKDSDGTIRLARDFESSGERLTLKAITQYKRPYFDVNIDNPPLPVIVREWLRKHKIQTLNVAGNAERRANGVNAFTIDYLAKVFKQR